ncbi:hypothetical protein JZ751_003152 [Albula glossodonta]|uniref:Uncharacterized protein n=1 Tax=Albula glossodonta TaxID=121402 RepID=A0A8T2NA36_9TELE|nr:hypothetical protein JZ751_003152 [Albula glossodonta]
MPAEHCPPQPLVRLSSDFQGKRLCCELDGGDRDTRTWRRQDPGQSWQRICTGSEVNAALTKRTPICQAGEKSSSPYTDSEDSCGFEQSLVDAGLCGRIRVPCVCSEMLGRGGVGGRGVLVGGRV